MTVDPMGNLSTFTAYSETVVPEATFLNCSHSSSLCKKRKHDTPGGHRPNACLVEPHREIITCLNRITAEHPIDQLQLSPSVESSETPIPNRPSFPVGSTGDMDAELEKTPHKDPQG